MLEQRIQQQFFESADLKYQSAEALARPIADAAAAILGAITSGGKLMVCGSAPGATLAPWLAQIFITRHERDRPPLAALALGALPTQEVAALGLPGDVLLLLDDGQGDAAATVAAAQARDMTVVALAGRGADALQDLLGETDVIIMVNAQSGARVAEIQLLVLHCLCDAVDFQLLGDQEP